MSKELGLLQKILLITLYGLIILMVVFSFGATKNIGKEGFDKCMEKRCEEVGEKSCSRFKEVSKCCQGAGGQMTASGCTFS